MFDRSDKHAPDDLGSVLYSLLDGEIVAVPKNLDDALARRQAIYPDPSRGMLLEVGLSVVDIVR